MAVRTRATQQQPPFCSSGKFGSYFPLRGSARQVAMYDQKADKFEYVDTCFSADHNMFDASNKVYFGMQGAVAWVDVNKWDETHDAAASQGWCPAVLDTNNDGKITPGWTEPNQPIDPTKDHRIDFGCYAVAVNAKDGSLWCSGIGRAAKRLMRLEVGKDAPASCKAEFYEPPPNQKPVEVIGSGGVEVDHQGVAWQNWRVSGHFSAFDRSKCKSTADPQGTGQSCPEGWTFYRKDDPTYDGSPYHTNESYLTHMDVHDTLGLGKDAPLYSNVNTDAFEVLQPSTKKFVTLRVPYPLGFFPRSANGRVDDPKAGWKGKGLWASYSSYATWHMEGGKAEGGPGALGKAVKFQIRPSPLAK
jgi:hypothetical protein